MFADSDTVTFRIYGKEDSGYAPLGSFSMIWKPADAGADSFIMNATLTYPDQSTVYESSGTEETELSLLCRTHHADILGSALARIPHCGLLEYPAEIPHTGF